MTGDRHGAVVEAPDDVVDRELWQDAQYTLAQHADDGAGRCQVCLTAHPCAGNRLADRAARASRQGPQAHTAIRSAGQSLTGPPRRPAARPRTAGDR